MRYLNTILAAAAVAGTAVGVNAQSAIDAYNMSPTELRGTARFVAMGGAFTSLGGDLSTMTQNPAGIGVYRHNDVGLSFSISPRSYKSQTSAETNTINQTKVDFNNIGYIGAYQLNGAMRTFNWGFSYNRLASFERTINGYNYPTSSSLTNYIASFTNGIDSGDMLFDQSTDYNPYLDSDCDWLSILAYNAAMINNNGSNTSYTGLHNSGTNGDAAYSVKESGYVDEYNIDFGGNVMDVLYWGVGVGIYDVSFTQLSCYSESMEDGLIYTGRGDNLSYGNAGFDLYNSKYITGSGANLKLGLIVHPIDVLRFGIAVHTPTWMRYTSSGYGEVDFNYTENGTEDTYSGNEYTDNFEYDWKLNTPWRFMVGASAVIGRKAIVSVDYERVAYNDMKTSYRAYNNYWGEGGYVSDDKVNADIKDYFKASNIIRAGIEYRVTPQFSVRAGYNYMTTNVRDAAADNRMEIATSGTTTGYTFDKDTQNITLGLGYRYKSWYIDLAYQHTDRKSTYHAYTPFENITDTPQASVKTRLNNIVISTGFRF